MNIPIEAHEREADHAANSHEPQTCPRCHALNGLVIGARGRIEPCPCNRGASKHAAEEIRGQIERDKQLGLKHCGNSIIMRDRSPTSRAADDGTVAMGST